MRKNIIFSAILTLCVVVLSFACVKADGVNKLATQNTKTDVLTVSQNDAVEDKVLEARFLNMLNHNFVYNQDFYSDAALVNNSMLALLDVAQDSFVEEAVLSDYIYNMYGKVYNSFDFLGENLPQKEGYVYILPRGYEEYTHTAASITANEDSSYTVITNVAISALDGSVQNVKCESLFLPAEDSAFGYNMLYSDIIEIAASQADC